MQHLPYHDLATTTSCQIPSTAFQAPSLERNGHGRSSP
jgi:hypothetical protein